jgi:hypothetical protein
MAFRKKKTLLDQAGEYVDAARPHVESALESAREFVHDTAIPALNDAREKAAPAIAEAREKAAPIIASGAAIAAEKATAAKEAADAKVSSLGPQPKKKSKVKRFLLFSAIAGAVAVVAKKLQGGSSSSDNWQSSYTPSPPPAPVPPTPPAPASGGDPLTDPLTDDQGGASPDEALADSAETPHAATTPDDPAEVVDLDEGKK